MLLGADTGFFLRLKAKDPEVVKRWEKVIKGEDRLIVSTISVNELLTHFFKSSRSKEGKELIETLKLMESVSLKPVTVEIAERSAGYRHGMGMHTTDSIILATFVIENCELIYTSDPDFQVAIDNKIANIKILR